MRRRRRAKHKLPAAEVNVISLMDVLTSLLFFLLLITAVAKFSVVPAKSTSKSTSTSSDETPSFALQVTLLSATEATIYLGPIEKLKFVRQKQLSRLLNKGFRGNPKIGYLSKISRKNHRSLMARVEQVLTTIKQSFPNELQATVAFTNRIRYRQMVSTVDRVRQKVGKPFETQNALGQKELSKILFPNVLITEWKGAS